jgi:hypothetical protein
LFVVKLPVVVPSRTRNWFPCAGTKPSIRVTLRVPASAAVPFTSSWSNWVSAVSPPISMSSDPPAVCV